LAKALGALYRIVYHKYSFDEIFHLVFVRPAHYLGKLFWLGGDEKLIDPYGPDGIATLSRRIAQRMAGLETGYIYHYAFAMVIGVTACVTWFWARG
jgi:NADH-quinone oxidoreductase subunit L